MKRCGYCGRHNEDVAEHCAACGTALEIVSPNPPHPGPERRFRSGVLNGWRATLIFLITVGVQCLTGVALAASMIAARRVAGDLNHRIASSAALVIATGLAGGAATLYASLRFVANLGDCSPCGAAWRLGDWGSMVRSFVFGLILAGLIIVAALGLKRAADGTVSSTAVGPSRGSKVLLAAFAVMFFPVSEELLFRGVLFGGYTKSLNQTWGATISTVLFVATHISGHINGAVMLGLPLLSMLALFSRLHWKAVGPAVAAHAGYNFAIAISRLA